MRRIALGSLILALAAPSSGLAQLATNQFINFVNSPVTVTYSASGQAQVKLTTAGPVLGIAGYRRVSVQIGSTHATNMRVQIGKIAGPTLSQFVFNGPADQKIHTFEVVGPELVLVLSGAPAGSTEHLQVWVYLTT